MRGFSFKDRITKRILIIVHCKILVGMVDVSLLALSLSIASKGIKKNCIRTVAITQVLIK